MVRYKSLAAKETKMRDFNGNRLYEMEANHAGGLPLKLIRDSLKERAEKIMDSLDAQGLDLSIEYPMYDKEDNQEYRVAGFSSWDKALKAVAVVSNNGEKIYSVELDYRCIDGWGRQYHPSDVVRFHKSLLEFLAKREAK